MIKKELTIAECMKKMTSRESTESAIREIISYHVKAALEAAADNALIESDPDEGRVVKRKEFEVGPHNGFIVNCTLGVDKDSILNAYPENLIQ